MAVRVPEILALDFDGVICNGLVEYFRTTCRTYCKIWDEDSQCPIEGISTAFFELRPVIETGWEMPILLRALIKGIPEEKINHNWSTISQQIVLEEELNPQEIAKELDGTRDEWIRKDLPGWLSLHEFYPGVIEKLRSLLDTQETQIYIVSTKEGRFIEKLLQQQGIELPPGRIIGKESKRPKYETLREIISQASSPNIPVWFVEDRLQALKLVQQQPDLSQVRLFLADWGYNTLQTREVARQNEHINVLSLTQFCQNLTSWYSL